MPEVLHVGSEVEAYCGSCHDLRWHIAVALVGDKPVKVECLSCHKQHGYRLEAAAPSARAAHTGKSGKVKALPRRAEPLFDADAIEARAHEARAYAPSQTFAAGDVVRHATFGLGLVTGVPGPQRIDVRFAIGPRLLVHDKKPTP